MGALAGFVVGYWLGAKSGPQGLQELTKAWEAISGSEEFQAMQAMALGYVQILLAQGGGELGGRLQALLAKAGSLNGDGDGRADESLVAAWSKISASEEFQALLASGTAMLGGVLTQGAAAFAPRSH